MKHNKKGQVKKYLLQSMLLACLSLQTLVVYANENRHHEHSDHHDKNKHAAAHHSEIHGGHHKEDQAVLIDENLLAELNITTETVGKSLLAKNVIAYGELSLGPENLSHVRARFPGLIESVAASVGDYVEAGDLLAEVESNESLKRYSIKAPIAGVIVQKHANKGEFTREQVLFSVANLDTLWAEIHVFPNLHSQVAAGQSLDLVVGGRSVRGSVEHIIPTVDKPYQLARAKINNSEGKLSAGSTIEARIIVDEVEVPLGIKKQALQLIDGSPGVFVEREGGDGVNKYEFQEVTLGYSDDIFYEVLSGLEEGDIYVVGNSFLLKADLQKSEAEHHH